MEQYKTFGQTLLDLLRSHQCTMKELTLRMGIKSANTIARIASDQTSPAKLREFYDAFIAQNPLQLVEYEKEQLREAITVTALGADVYAAQKQMLYFVRERLPQPACVCTQEFGQTGSLISTFDDLMLSYQEYASVRIVVKNAALGGVTRGLKALLQQNSKTEISIEHYVSASDKRVKEIDDFLNLLDLMGHPTYSFYFFPYQRKDELDFLDVYSNFMIALKLDHAGNKWTDVVSFHTPETFTVLHNVPGENAYEFHSAQFQALRLQHNPANTVRGEYFTLEDTVSYTRHLLELDLTGPVFSIRPDISQCMVPPDITRALTETQFAHLPHTPQTRALLEEYCALQNRRHQLFTAPGRPQMFLFSRVGMHTFLHEGKSRANIFHMRDLTRAESRAVIENMLHVARTNTDTTFHLMKNELNYSGTSYLLYRNGSLFIDNYQGSLGDEESPMQNYHAAHISAPNIVQNLEHFITDDLVPNYTYPHEESIEFLQQLLQES